MPSAKLQRSLGLILALFAIGFLAILAFPPHWHSKAADKPAVTAEMANSSKGENSSQ